MKRFFEQELQMLRSHLVLMGRKSVDQVGLAVQALLEGDVDLAERVRGGDDEIDQLEMAIDAEAIAYMSLRSPVAGELRLVVVGMKAGHDLERVGDEANNIAKRVKRLAAPLSPGQVREDLSRMAEMVIEMLQDALDAFLQTDDKKALSVCRRDGEVDKLNKKIFRDVTARMMEQPAFVPAALELLFVSRSLERVADHSTNISEEVIYLLRGEDVRHSDEIKKAR